MEFNSLTFVVFVAIIFGLHSLPLSWRIKKVNLVVASYLFYAAWNPPFVILLWLSTTANWLIARRIFHAKTALMKRFLLGLALFTNLGVLGFFKYSNFVLANFVAAAETVGIVYRPLQPSIILPIGISFYTFEAISYVVDVYRADVRSDVSLTDFALFISFFPHLVAGPILRATTFLAQCEVERKASFPEISRGLSLFILGIFEKVVIADRLLAPVADSLFSSDRLPSFTAAWVGTLAFSGQIFCDFAGYSTCAIGIAVCFGFTLPRNFRFPYASVGFSDFWRRWHISLSSWLRDYVYIPLGGSRQGQVRTRINLMLTMLIGGFWHGAAWTFVIWGGLHGTFLIAERGAMRWLGHLGIWKTQSGRLILGFGTFALICVTWAFFRAQSVDQAIMIVRAMIGLEWSGFPLGIGRSEQLKSTIVTLGIVRIHLLLRDTSIEQVIDQSAWWARALALVGMLVLLFATSGEDRAFIYFQF